MDLLPGPQGPRSGDLLHPKPPKPPLLAHRAQAWLPPVGFEPFRPGPLTSPPTPGAGGQSLGLEVTVKVTALSPSQPRLQEGLKPPPTWNLLCFQEVPGPPPRTIPPPRAPGCLRTCLGRPGVHHPMFLQGRAGGGAGTHCTLQSSRSSFEPSALGPPCTSRADPRAFGLLRLLNFKRIKPGPGSALGLGLCAQDPQPLVSNAKDTEKRGQGREAKSKASSPQLGIVEAEPKTGSPASGLCPPGWLFSTLPGFSASACPGLLTRAAVPRMQGRGEPGRRLPFCHRDHGGQAASSRPRGQGMPVPSPPLLQGWVQLASSQGSRLAEGGSESGRGSPAWR